MIYVYYDQPRMDKNSIRSPWRSYLSIFSYRHWWFYHPMVIRNWNWCLQIFIITWNSYHGFMIYARDRIFSMSNWADNYLLFQIIYTIELILNKPSEYLWLLHSNGNYLCYVSKYRAIPFFFCFGYKFALLQSDQLHPVTRFLPTSTITKRLNLLITHIDFFYCLSSISYKCKIQSILYAKQPCRS